TFVGLTDTLGHPDSVRAIRRAAPQADVYEVTLPGGHFGLVVGAKSMETTWPAVAEWVRWREGRAELPETIAPADTVDAKASRPGAGVVALAQATELGIGVGRVLIGSAVRASRSVRGVARQAPAQIPRLNRIEQLRPGTRISLGLLLDEQARRAPGDIAFLFGDRAHRQHDVKVRVDNVVKGLIEIGVRHGDRVGVLMNTRPSAFTVITAISRLGATAVLLRPDGDVPRELALGHAAWVVADPDHLDRVADAPDTVEGHPVRWAVLGGGGPEGAERSHGLELPDRVIDMEQIDPDAVEWPAWYTPNPHRTGDLAFVLFTGEGASTKALHITNRRWALSALGTASAAALKPGDTVLSVTPLHHSSALLMSIGGAVASGARFAIASADDPETFWYEVRRYGATVVSYTWASLREVVNTPPTAYEQHNPIRMFIGSGMPRNLWRRVTERFPSAKVLEFYASAEGEAILANVRGRTPGSMGRPLPGTAEVRVACFDLPSRTLELGADGLAREAAVDEVGLLLARVEASEAPSGAQLRGVFEGGDAWRSTGDLFLRDEHGDLWLAGPVSEIVDTPRGQALPSGARFALATIPAGDLIVAYGVDAADGDGSVLVAAMTLRPGTDVTTAELDQALDKLPEVQRPGYVVVVNSIPLTTWHRPIWSTLQAKGVPTPSRSRRVWQLADDRTHYQELERTPAKSKS
ncbi:AMP-binding protein, partial [Jatrophihabitans endophyticus]|uniref:AMP-binding protein n=1 Tax=Jatrophihabitans endophyticus TaxID=1206085 RepID=UPI0019F9223E